jgi:hypothetical protein
MIQKSLRANEENHVVQEAEIKSQLESLQGKQEVEIARVRMLQEEIGVLNSLLEESNSRNSQSQQKITVSTNCFWLSFKSFLKILPNPCCLPVIFRCASNHNRRFSPLYFRVCVGGGVTYCLPRNCLDHMLLSMPLIKQRCLILLRKVFRCKTEFESLMS